MTTQTKTNHLDGAITSLRTSRGAVFGAIIITALMAFEIFNYSTTDYALTDLLGNLTFMGLRWATILSIAFCGIDFAGIARLFGSDMTRAHNENWFLFGAWLLAATMNATLTWWGVSLAILNHQTAGSAVVSHETMLRVGPIFVAVLVWLIRVLIIGTFSSAGDRLFGGETASAQPLYRPIARPAAAAPTPRMSSQPRPAIATPASSAGRPTGTHSFNNRPPRYRVSEPEYTDSDEAAEGEIVEPGYAPAPLAARPTSRPGGASAPPRGSNSGGRRF